MHSDAIKMVPGKPRWRKDMLAFAAVAVVALLLSLQQTNVLGALVRFAAAAVLGWMIVAALVTLAFGVSSLVVSLPDILGDFHALSRFPVNVTIANTGSKWPAMFLTITLETATAGRKLPSPPIFIARLDAGEAVTRGWLVTGRARGDFEITALTVTSAFPGSPFAASASAPLSRHLLALPAIYRLHEKALDLLKGMRLAAGRQNAIPAASEEFLGVRLYRPGDNPRSIHPVLSMRAPDYPLQLVVREFEDPSADDVIVILENGPPSGEAGLMSDYRREKALSFSVGLCRLLCEHKYHVRFRSTDEAGRAIIEPVEQLARDLPRLQARLARLGWTVVRTSLSDTLRQETRSSNAAILLVSLTDKRPELTNPRLPLVTITPAAQVALTAGVVGV